MTVTDGLGMDGLNDATQQERKKTTRTLVFSVEFPGRAVCQPPVNFPTLNDISSYSDSSNYYENNRMTG